MKNKIIEGALDIGVQQSYQTKSTSTSSDLKNKPSINIKKKDLNDPNLQKNLSGLKDVDVNIVESEEAPQSKNKIEYLSNVKDSKTGEISQPFTIEGKRYQIIRGLSSDKQKVMAVYSLDETNESGENIIYSTDEFEANIAKKNTEEEGVVEPEGSEAVTLTQEEPKSEPEPEVKPEKEEKKEDTGDKAGDSSFAGFKHYIVNKKTGKARKFKTIEDLAKAKMDNDEQYMGIKDFKKYVDETLFGASKKKLTTELDTVTGQENDEEMSKKAEKLMEMIKNKIPDTIFKTINTPVAQREVIAAFAKIIGVNRKNLSSLISTLKDLSSTEQPVNERTIIKVKNLKNYV